MMGISGWKIQFSSWLPIKGNNPAAITGRSNNLALTEVVKAKYKLGRVAKFNN